MYIFFNIFIEICNVVLFDYLICLINKLKKVSIINYRSSKYADHEINEILMNDHPLLFLNIIYFFESRYKILSTAKRPVKPCKTFLKFCQSVKISPNLVTPVAFDTAISEQRFNFLIYGPSPASFSLPVRPLQATFVAT